MSPTAQHGAAPPLGPDVAIVIFGAAVRRDGSPSTTLRRRVEAAAAFGLRHPGALFVPTGAVGTHGPSEASVMAALLDGFGVPPDRILLEESGTDTLSSVLAVRRLLMAQPGASRRVYAATSAYHLPRCVLLLRLAGLRARACPPPASPAATRRSTRWYWRLRECAALPWDVSIIVVRRAVRRL